MKGVELGEICGVVNFLSTDSNNSSTRRSTGIVAGRVMLRIFSRRCKTLLVLFVGHRSVEKKHGMHFWLMGASGDGERRPEWSIRSFSKASAAGLGTTSQAR